MRNDLTEALRIRVFPQLPGSDFYDALKEAVDYHNMHPPGELVILSVDDRRDAEVDKMIEASKDRVTRSHREKVMMPFLRKDVPYSIAKEIVDNLVLNEQPAG